MMMRSALYWTNTLSWIFIVPLKQQSADRHVAPLGHIILIPSQPVFVLSPQCCVLSGEATNTNFIVFGLTLSGLEPTIYRTRGEHANHYNINTIHFGLIILLKGFKVQLSTIFILKILFLQVSGSLRFHLCLHLQ